MMVEKDLGPFCDTFYLDGTCPFPGGNYSLSDYPVSQEEYEKLIPPYIPGSEKWRIVMELSINGTARGGGVYDLTISHDKRMTVLSG